jgi:hypothetical protein
MTNEMINGAALVFGVAFGLWMGLKVGYKRGDAQGSRRGFARGLQVSRDLVARITNATR